MRVLLFALLAEITAMGAQRRKYGGGVVYTFFAYRLNVHVIYDVFLGATFAVIAVGTFSTA